MTARPLRDRRQVEEPVVVSARLALGQWAGSGSARARQSARHEVDGAFGPGCRHTRHALGRLDRLLRLARVHPDAHPASRVVVQPRRGRDDGLHRRVLMTRQARLATQGLAVALVVGLLALLVWRVANDNGKGVAQKLGDGEHPTAPAVDLSRLDGPGRIDLASLRGRKPIVLDFWASWCVPCIRESKRLEAARKEYGDRVAFIGVDTKDFSSDARQWQKKHGITYPSVHDGR